VTADNVPCAQQANGIAPPPHQILRITACLPYPRRDLPPRNDHRCPYPQPPADGSSWDENSSIARLVALERRGGAETNVDATFSESMACCGSNSEFSFGQEASAGANNVGEVDVLMFCPSENKRGRVRVETLRDSVRSHSPWWVSDGSFDPPSLLVAGERVSLILAPLARSICAGHTCLVSMAHAPSLAGFSPEVWDEMHRFRRSLHNMYTKEKVDVIYMETVTDSSGVVQTWMDAVPVLKRCGEDAPMYFKNSLAEIMDGWATQTKVVKTGGR